MNLSIKVRFNNFCVKIKEHGNVISVSIDLTHFTGFVWLKFKIQSFGYVNVNTYWWSSQFHLHLKIVKIKVNS